MCRLLNKDVAVDIIIEDKKGCAEAYSFFAIMTLLRRQHNWILLKFYKNLAE